MKFSNLNEQVLAGVRSLNEDINPAELKHGTDADNEFDAEQLKAGMEVEKEHSDDPEVQKAIAKSHLKEDPQYYVKLKKYVESKNENSLMEDYHLPVERLYLLRAAMEGVKKIYDEVTTPPKYNFNLNLAGSVINELIELVRIVKTKNEIGADDMISPIGDGNNTEKNKSVTEDIEIGDKVKVIGAVQGKDKTGKVVDTDSKHWFSVVDFGNKKISYNNSDLKKLESKVNETFIDDILKQSSNIDPVKVTNDIVSNMGKETFMDIVKAGLKAVGYIRKNV